MLAELVPVRNRWEETQAALLDCLSGIPDEQFLWKPAPQATSASEIVTHIARAEIGYALLVLQHPREQRPDFTVTNRASALGAMETAAGWAVRAMDEVTELDRVVTQEWYPLGPRVEGPLTALWFIEQMIRHKAYHLGQLWYLRMLLEE
ncbi:MAG TPA: DinB family protein [Armatimonadota bacterium]|nr:DinB family protein [Armatimonadota bacterium]